MTNARSIHSLMLALSVFVLSLSLSLSLSFSFSFSLSFSFQRCTHPNKQTKNVLRSAINFISVSESNPCPRNTFYPCYLPHILPNLILKFFTDFIFFFADFSTFNFLRIREFCKISFSLFISFHLPSSALAKHLLCIVPKSRPKQRPPPSLLLRQFWGQFSQNGLSSRCKQVQGPCHKINNFIDISRGRKSHT